MALRKRVLAWRWLALAQGLASSLVWLGKYQSDIDDATRADQSSISEIVPVKHRGYSIAALTCFVAVFTPYIFYCQLLGTRATWRWTAWISLIYNGITGIGIVVFYHPHNHTRAEGFSYSTILAKIDYVGGALSISGLTLL